jgi:methionyl-tRNA formyltransferase
MGTPEFAAASLSALLKDDTHEVAAVFCRSDKPNGRGMKLTPCPVKQIAQERGIHLYQPDNFTDGAAENALRRIAPDVAVVAAYGKILPQNCIDVPKLGTINVHASLLPRWRGAAPIQRAIMAGDEVTGITIQQVTFELDAGDILKLEPVVIEPDETYGELYDRLKIVGADLLLKTLSELPNVAPRPQIGDVTYAKPISKQDREIDFTRSAKEIINHVRGLCPNPAATALLSDGQRYKIFRTREVTHAEPGLIIPLQNGGFISIEELQAPGGKRMQAKDFLRGHKL